MYEIIVNFNGDECIVEVQWQLWRSYGGPRPYCGMPYSGPVCEAA